MEDKDINTIKTQVLTILEHPEAEEGLYFRNFFHLHEEDERPAVEAEEPDLFDALQQLIKEGKVQMNEGGDEVILQLIAR